MLRSRLLGREASERATTFFFFSVTAPAILFSFKLRRSYRLVMRHISRAIPPVTHQGKRVAEGQKKMQTESDPFLGYTTINGRDFLVRQLADHKAAIDPLELKGTTLLEYGRVCGEVLAKAHARTGDAGAIAGYCGKSPALDNAMAKFAKLCADQTESDYEQFKKAIAKGRVRVVLGK